MLVLDGVMTSHDICTSASSRVLTVESLQRLKLEVLIPAHADCEVRSVIKFKSRCWPKWWGSFRGFPQTPRQMLCWIYITTIHLTSSLVVVDSGFTTLLTSQVISVTFYSEREKSDKFCSEARISAWGSFTCRKSTTRDPRLYLLSEGSHTQDFYTLKKKKSIDPDRVWTREPLIQWRVW